MSYKPKVLAVGEGGTGIASAGNAGNVLTSNGSIWASSAALSVVSGTLTSAQIKTLHASPVQIIAAPGSGKMIVLGPYLLVFKYGGSNVFVAGAAQQVSVYYSTTQVDNINLSNATITGTTNLLNSAGTQALNSVANTSVANLAINLYNSVATEISGNAANDNVIDYAFYYNIVTL